MRIVFASDHAGFPLKEILVPFVQNELGHSVTDVGAFALDPVDDYPDFVSEAARMVAEEPDDVRGIILGGSGQGEAIVANRYPGVRAAVYYGGGPEILLLSREHNNANVLSLGARFLNEEEAKDAVRLWLEAPFSYDDRHVRRIEKIDTE